MLSKSSPAYLSVPNEHNQKTLHEGRVLDMDGPRVLIEFDDMLAPAAGAEVMLFAEVRYKFFQQGAMVIQERQDTPRTTIEFHLVGEPVSAEQRGSYRTSVVTWKIPVEVETIANCTLADISPEGVGIVTPKPLIIGTSTEIAFDFDGHVIRGKFRVQSVKILPTGFLRFGLHVAERRDPMRMRLQQLASHAQRVQLRRLSGAA